MEMEDKPLGGTGTSSLDLIFFALDFFFFLSFKIYKKPSDSV
jgi:hypothetical protein